MKFRIYKSVEGEKVKFFAKQKKWWGWGVPRDRRLRSVEGYMEYAYDDYKYFDTYEEVKEIITIIANTYEILVTEWDTDRDFPRI